MKRWWEPLSSPLWPEFDVHTWRHMLVQFVLSLPSGGFSTGFSSFPASTQRPTFQISIQIQRQKKKHHLEEVPLLKSETISIFIAIEYAILGKIPL